MDNWKIGEYDEHLGYDCMTGGIRVGRAILDGADYGQQRCETIKPEQLEQMMTDARLISAAPDMLALLKHLYEYGYTNFADHDRVRDMISKAEGRS